MKKNISKGLLFLGERSLCKNDLFLNDKVYCISRSTLDLDVIGVIQAIKQKKISLKVKSLYGAHINQDEYHIFIKRRKTKKNDRDFYKALLNAL